MVNFYPSEMAKKKIRETEARKKGQDIPEEHYTVPMTDKQIEKWEQAVREAEKIASGKSNP